MEQNLGPAVAGVQESGWFLDKTLELSKQGVLLTYSGDLPFLMRLVLGTTNESVSPSKIPLYTTELDYTPTKVHHEHGLQSDVTIPFRTGLPKSSLVFYENIQSVRPDATHMTTRCVENDLQRIARKTIREKYPNHNAAIRQLDLTRKLDKKRCKETIFYLQYII